MSSITTAYLKSIRKRMGLTQKDMAAQLGYESVSGYNALENGQVKMTVEQLIQIRDVLQLTNDELITFFLNQ